MLKRKILFLVTTIVINSSVFAASEMADRQNMNMNMSQSDHKVMMMQKDMKTMDEKMMKALGSKDATYDKRFMELMIAHHEGGIMMAKDALNKSERPEIKEMAQKIIDSQEKEIQQMKDWEKTWYGQ